MQLNHNIHKGDTEYIINRMYQGANEWYIAGRHLLLDERLDVVKSLISDGTLTKTDNKNTNISKQPNKNLKEE